MSMRHRLAAWGELLRRYRTVFRFYWKERNAMPSGLFNEQEAAFLPAALALQEQPVSPVARITGRVLMTLVAVLLAWSILGKVDIVVNAAGKIIPSGRTKTVASVDVASVRALHVREGQSVKAGDLLIELDTSVLEADRDKARGDAMVASLLAARSLAMITAVDTLKPPRLARIEDVPEEQWLAAQRHLMEQYRDFQAKLARIDGEIRRYGQALPLVTKRARDFKELAAQHDVSTHAWLEQEQARIDLEGQLASVRNQRAELIAQTRKEAHDALTEGDRMAHGSTQDALRAEAHRRLLKLTAPVDGTVQQLAVHTVGGVVPAAQQIMLVVPKEDKVEIEAFIENKDIGFIQLGQQAAVKIDAFEYTKYGTILGRVSHVSHDAIEDEKKGLIYAVKVLLDRSTLKVDGKEMPLNPGMSVNVEIKTGDRRVIEYVLSPILRHQRESLNER
ncbi:HlyD family type I secretion periplasmic adaptor subunit [Desulfobulbus sp.]|uniref:HlyD family type I secretion periplasmic adaptor subunit n=1 Tax=Desulfobulbus sp. TaxID=895 RepID=UPI00286F2912|nr:HlyD family type I secretion periplasmic adaptor subunit [Desulfobulbus sp.]